MPASDDDSWPFLCINCMGKGLVGNETCEKCEGTGFVEENVSVKTYLNDEYLISVFNDVSFFKKYLVLPNDGNRKQQTKDFLECLNLYDAMNNAYTDMRNKRNGRK